MTKKLQDALSKPVSEKYQLKLRQEQADRAIQGRWFKHIPGGEFLGDVITKYFDETPDDAPLKQCINSLISWCLK